MEQRRGQRFGVRLDVEDVVMRVHRLEQIAGGGVFDALGLGRRSTGVEEIEEVLGVHLLSRTRAALLGDEVVVPVVATLDPLDVAAGALDDDHVLHRRTVEHRLVGALLEGHRLAAAPTLATIVCAWSSQVSTMTGFGRLRQPCCQMYV